MKWVDSYKYITYTTPDGQRFRDNRLPENKYLKSNMEVLFNNGYEKFKTTESDRSRDERNGEIIDRTDTTDVLNAETGAVQSDSETHFVDWESHCREHGFDIKVADTRRFGSDSRGNNEILSVENDGFSNRQNELNKGTKSGLPKHELEILARHFLPQIQAFFESKKGREEYAAWQQEQALLKAQRANNEP